MHEWHIAGRVLAIGKRPLVMGIVNVTPDSFSDGGRTARPEEAVAHGLELARQGADVLDVGGESTRPGALPVSAEEERSRVIPVIRELAMRAGVPVSVDTSKPEVAQEALAAGATIVNDVTALAAPGMAEIVRRAGAGVILMHMQGTPATMQLDPHYGDVVREVGDFLESRLRAATAAGLGRPQTVLDPGIGFGKTRQHNLELLTRLREFQRFGRPVCLGVSRKGFLGNLLGERPADRRLAVSLAAACFAISQQAVQMLRVHDVEETRDAVTIFEALSEGQS